MTEVVPRTRGALTGNSLAAWFGKLLVEDALMTVQPRIENSCFKFMNVVLRPMAWSDNIVAFAKSSRRVARILTLIAYQLESMHLHVSDGSLEVVPASTRRLQWPAIRVGPFLFSVADETKLLGYHLACNGDTGRSRATLNGALRGRLACMGKRFSQTSPVMRAKWWQQQFRGYVGYFAAFLGINAIILRRIGAISNLGARHVCKLHRNFNVHDRLMHIRRSFDIDVESFFVQTVVNWLGHCFRHKSQPVSLLLSLPLDGRLSGLRARGSETPLSNSALASWLALFDVGLDIEFPVSGRPNVRGSSGYAFRWGEGWFGQIRDGGVGWDFERSAESDVAKRVQILLKLFSRSRAPRTLAIEDEPHQLLQLHD